MIRPRNNPGFTPLPKGSIIGVNSRGPSSPSCQGYEILSVIGQGAFGIVYNAMCHDVGQQYAIKQISIQALRARGMTKYLEREVEIHKNLKHPLVCELRAHFEERGYKYLVLEPCLGGTLQSLLRERWSQGYTQPLSEREAGSILRQVVEGVLYLHENQIIHRDLSMVNILFTERRKQVKICDFGLATKLSGPNDLAHTMCGTPSCISPEVASGGSHGQQTDVFSIGCLLYMMFVGRPPFPGPTMAEVLFNVCTEDPEIPDHLSLDAQELLRGLLEKDHNKRMSLMDILLHPFLSKLSGYQDVRLVQDDSGVCSIPSRMLLSGTAASTRDTQQHSQLLSSARVATPALHVEPVIGNPAIRRINDVQQHKEYPPSLHLSADMAAVSHSRPVAAGMPRHVSHTIERLCAEAGDAKFPSRSSRSLLDTPYCEAAADCVPKQVASQPGSGVCEATLRCQRCRNCALHVRTLTCCCNTPHEVMGPPSSHSDHNQLHSSLATSEHLVVTPQQPAAVHLSTGRRPEETAVTGGDAARLPGQTAVTSAQDVVDLPPPFSTNRLKPEQRTIPPSCSSKYGHKFSILPSGEVTFELYRPFTDGFDRVVQVFRVTSDGLRIAVHRPKQNGVPCILSDAPASCSPQDAELFNYSSLADKHKNYLPMYIHTAAFVSDIQSVTIKLTCFSKQARFRLMENSPNPNFRAELYDGGLVTRIRGAWRLKGKDGQLLPDPLQLEHADPQSLVQRMWDIAQKGLQRCLSLDSCLSKQSADEGVDNFPAILGRKWKPTKHTQASSKQPVNPMPGRACRSIVARPPESLCPPHKNQVYSLPNPHCERVTSSLPMPRTPVQHQVVRSNDVKDIGVLHKLANGDIHLDFAKDKASLIRQHTGNLVFISDSRVGNMSITPTEEIPDFIKHRYTDLKRALEIASLKSDSFKYPW